jgi:hypothetical protein
MPEKKLIYQRQNAHNMPVSIDKKKLDQMCIDAEDFQDESKMKAMMANVMCMTEKDVKL